MEHLEPLAERVREAGVECETVVRPGLAADQIIAYLRKREGGKIDRIVMGTHSPGPIGKLLVGSVAEAVLRTARTPVFIVGPEVVDGRYRNFATRTILCAVSLHPSSAMVAALCRGTGRGTQRALGPAACDPAAGSRTRFSPAGRSKNWKPRCWRMIPAELRAEIAVQSIVVPGDPTEELLYQGRAQQADLIVLGAQGASAFAAITRHGVVYKVLAHAHCPVMTLSPVVLAECGAQASGTVRRGLFSRGFLERIHE